MYVLKGWPAHQLEDGWRSRDSLTCHILDHLLSGAVALLHMASIFLKASLDSFICHILHRVPSTSNPSIKVLFKCLLMSRSIKQVILQEHTSWWRKLAGVLVCLFVGWLVFNLPGSCLFVWDWVSSQRLVLRWRNHHKLTYQIQYTCSLSWIS